MKITLIISLLLSLLLSCKKDEILVKEIYSGCCFDQDRPVALSKTEMIILANKEMLTDGEAAKYGYTLNIIKINADTLKEIDTTVSTKDYDKINNKMKGNSFYYDSIGNIKFSYDKIPAEFDSIFSKDEKIDHFIHYKDKYIFTTVNNSLNIRNDSERNKLYVQSTKNNKKKAMILEVNSMPTPEILLYDFIGDIEPEIFVINNYYFMNHYLTSFTIYQTNL